MTTRPPVLWAMMYLAVCERTGTKPLTDMSLSRQQNDSWKWLHENGYIHFTDQWAMTDAGRAAYDSGAPLKENLNVG